MTDWKNGFEYPDPIALSGAYHEKASENVKTMFKYFAADAVLTTVFLICAQEVLIFVAGVIALAVIAIWMAYKRHGYAQIAKSIDRGDFKWRLAKLQNKYKRSIIDLLSGPLYQVRFEDEWVETDFTTYNDCIIGKSAVILQRPHGVIVATPIPEGASRKRLKRLARAS